MRLLITDDHAVVRQGLKEILASKFPQASFGEAETAQQALDRVQEVKWDVVLLDITMPGRSGLDVLKDLKAARPEMRILIWTMHPEEQFAVQALKAGADGYLTKRFAADEVVNAINRLLAGGKYVSPSLAEKLATAIQIGAEHPLHEKLSTREFEVLRMVAGGKSAKEIAAELGVSAQTVSTYRSRIFAKMRLRTNAELTQYAVAQGLVAR